MKEDLLLNGVRLSIDKAGSQNKLAKLVGVQQCNVSKWLHRDKKVPLEKAIKIEKVLGIPRDVLRPDIEW